MVGYAALAPPYVKIVALNVLIWTSLFEQPYMYAQLNRPTTLGLNHTLSN